MAPVIIPDSGLVLPASYSNPGSSKDGISIPQIMQMELENGVLHELIRSARHAVKSPHISFGKTIVSNSLDNSVHRKEQ